MKTTLVLLALAPIATVLAHPAANPTCAPTDYHCTGVAMQVTVSSTTPVYGATTPSSAHSSTSTSAHSSSATSTSRAASSSPAASTSSRPASTSPAASTTSRPASTSSRATTVSAVSASRATTSSAKASSSSTKPASPSSSVAVFKGDGAALAVNGVLAGMVGIAGMVWAM